MKQLHYKVWAGLVVLWLASFSAASQAQATWGQFGNASGPDADNVFAWPSSAEVWAGWACTNCDGVYPYTFPEGGEITFTGQADVPTSIRFRFEFIATMLGVSCLISLAIVILRTARSRKDEN